MATPPSRMVGGTNEACGLSPGWIIAELEAGSETFLAGPSGETPSVPVPSALTTAVRMWHGFQTSLERPRWEVEAAADENGYTFNVALPGGPTVVEATFDRRIELAASSTSPSGRFAVFVQANNLATEVTILDAERAERWAVELPHNAMLAAFAISIHFSAADECLVISEERAASDGPETWYIDLKTQQVSEPVPGFVVALFG